MRDNFSTSSGYLEGQLLIATPQLVGSCFEKAVIYLCAHSPEGAMGLIINHPVSSISASDIFSQLEIPVLTSPLELPVHFGGPVDAARGFVLHSPDYNHAETVLMQENIALTCNLNILRDIATGKGPEKKLLCLGYAGWTAGQLESELETNSWLTAEATDQLIFNSMNDSKWHLAAQSEGIDLAKLSGDVGHA